MEFGGLRERSSKFLIIWSSEKGSMVDALALSDEEGRGKLRKARGRSKHPIDPWVAEWGNPADC
jgi:hypothetical protein